MSSYNPKTPTRRSRPTEKTPLTPSILNGINALNIVSSPSKSSKHRHGKTPSKDTAVIPPLTANTLFHSTRSRPTSPLKRIINGSGLQVTEELSRQANSGLIRRGALESRMDVVKMDYVMPTKTGDEASGNGAKRSRSLSGIRRERLFPNEQTTIPLDTRDRFINARDIHDLESTLSQMHISNSMTQLNQLSKSTSSTSLSGSSSHGRSAGNYLSRSASNPPTSSPGHTARLAEAANIPLGKRVLSYHEPPPPASADPMLAAQREFVKPLYARPGSLISTSSSAASKTRKLPTQPERVLDAPGIVDDFYLNLISWSRENIVSVALGESTYLWRGETGEVVHLGDVAEGSYVSSVEFSNDGLFLGQGVGSGEVELWDIESSKKLRTMTGHQHQVACLSWSGHILASGCGDGSVWLHDVRVARHKVLELLGHSGEVCGLKWQPTTETERDGAGFGGVGAGASGLGLLASGGNDNVVSVWDVRAGLGGDTLGNAGNGGRIEPKWVKRNHTAAVKALAWSPWLPTIVASGGGTNDSTINIWNTTTGSRIHTCSTPAQITSLHFSPYKKELLSTHGYPTNSIMVHVYPSFEKVGEVRDAHDSRVLFSCVGPRGDVVMTGAGDENLKFWRVWEVPKASKSKKEAGSRRGMEAMMMLR